MKRRERLEQDITEPGMFVLELALYTAPAL
jgi:hypothetical protein